MLAELTKKQHELYALVDAFHEFRCFALEIRRATRGKRFDIASPLAWEAVLAMHRVLVIDLAAWIDSLLPPRFRGGPPGWLETHLDSQTLGRLVASRMRAEALVAKERLRAPADIEGLLREQRVQELLQSHGSAMRRVFGRVAVRRGRPTEQDVRRLEKRIGLWAKNLRRWRNTHAHRYGKQTGTVRALRLPDLAKRFVWCARLMNDLRMLVDSSTFVMPRLEPSDGSATARDLVDLIVVGTIQYAVHEWQRMPGEWLWQKRDAYYGRMHRRRRRSPTDSFNRHR